MSLKHGLLGLLKYGDMTGYDLDKAFKASLHPAWNAQTSQIYRELLIMEEKGWLSSRVELQQGKPNRKYYQITDEGVTELKQWLSTDHLTEELFLKHPFFLQLFFAGENTLEENIDLLSELKKRCKNEIDTIERMYMEAEEYRNHVADENKTKYWQLANSLGKSYYQNFIDWADGAIESLKEKE
jgi:Predicted transcriptional regulators